MSLYNVDVYNLDVKITSSTNGVFAFTFNLNADSGAPFFFEVVVSDDADYYYSKYYDGEKGDESTFYNGYVTEENASLYVPNGSSSMMIRVKGYKYNWWATFTYELFSTRSFGPYTVSISNISGSAPTVTANATGSTTINVSYTGSTGGRPAVSAYYYTLNGGGSYTPAGASPFTISGLSAATSYYVVIYAYNPSWPTPYVASSPSNSVTTYNISGTAPTVTAIATGSTTINVSYTSSVGGTPAVYAYYYTLNGVGSYTPAGTSPFTISAGLTAATSYYVVIYAYNPSWPTPYVASSPSNTVTTYNISSPVSCGNGHTMLVTSEGLFATGVNDSGQLGINNNFTNIKTFQQITGYNGTIDSVSCGFAHTMLVTSNGSGSLLFATGSNGSGQLGISNFTNRTTFQQITTGYSGKIVSVSCGANHTMLVTSNGLFATGYNLYGQLGTGNNSNINTFQQITTGYTGTIISVSCGYNHTMLVTSDGLFATGLNDFGQLGTGNNNDRNTFQKITTYSGTIMSVSCGDNHTMLVTSYGLFVTGRNNPGQLGTGDTTNRNTFQPIATEYTGQIISMSVSCGNSSTMLVTSDGLFATGYNFHGQLGTGNNDNITTFQKITGETISVSCGNNYTMLVTPDGLFATGFNIYGQLGSNDNISKKTFQRITGYSGTIQGPIKKMAKYLYKGRDVAEHISSSQAITYSNSLYIGFPIAFDSGSSIPSNEQTQITGYFLNASLYSPIYRSRNITYDAPGTYNNQPIPSWCNYVKVIMLGAGGGGGGGGGASNNVTYPGDGGGGGGGSSGGQATYQIQRGSSVSNTFSVTVGAGGGAGREGERDYSDVNYSNFGGDGGRGGTTTFSIFESSINVYGGDGGGGGFGGGSSGAGGVGGWGAGALTNGYDNSNAKFTLLQGFNGNAGNNGATKSAFDKKGTGGSGLFTQPGWSITNVQLNACYGGVGSFGGSRVNGNGANGNSPGLGGFVMIFFFA